jgi:hypothetical protein
VKKLDDSMEQTGPTSIAKISCEGAFVRWPNQPAIHGGDKHEQEAMAFFKAFPGQRLVNNPHKITVS